MKRKIAISDTKLKTAFQKYFEGKELEIIVISKDNVELAKTCDILALCANNIELPPEIYSKTKILNFHPALLPSFKDANSLEKSYLSGIKVSGITIHEVYKDDFYGKILAQYPVLIGITTHYNEYAEEIFAACEMLYPRVVEAVLNDTVFDFTDLLKPSCKGSCGNCSHCSK